MSVLLANPRKLMATIAASILMPPPPVDYLQWAIDNIEFRAADSAFPGPYNRDLFPFFDEIYKALSPNDPCRIVSFKKSAQLGGTVVANVFVGGSMVMDPGYFMYVHPTDGNGARWSRMKLKPFIETTDCLNAIFKLKVRDTAGALMYKERTDGQGAILISGANSAASLSMSSVSKQVQDDLSKWQMNDAGDPETQADSRSRAFEFAKLFKVSTPMIDPGCRITNNYKQGTQEVYEIPCPHCDFYQTLEWDNFLTNWDENNPGGGHFICADPACGGVIEEHHRYEFNLKGRWVAQNPGADERSFYIWSAYSPLQSFARIGKDWANAKGDPAKEQTFDNDVVGVAHKAADGAPPWEEIQKRAEAIGHQRGIIPFNHPLLLMGIDCQGDRVEWQVVAFGPNLCRAVIDHGVITDHISEDTCRAALDKLIKQKWRNESGQVRPLDLTAIDGNAWTNDVWDWTKRHPISNVIMVRGANHENAPLFVRVKRQYDKNGKLLKYSKRFYNFGTSTMKMWLYRNLRKDDPTEKGFVSLPKGLDDDYYRQLTSESRKPTVKKDGFIKYAWVKSASQANEMLDTMLQAEAAGIKLGLRSMDDAAWATLIEERDCGSLDPQLDLEEMPLVKPVLEENKPAPAAVRTSPEQKTKAASIASKLAR